MLSIMEQEVYFFASVKEVRVNETIKSMNQKGWIVQQISTAPLAAPDGTQLISITILFRKG